MIGLGTRNSLLMAWLDWVMKTKANAKLAHMIETIIHLGLGKVPF